MNYESSTYIDFLKFEVEIPANGYFWDYGPYPDDLLNGYGTDEIESPIMRPLATNSYATKEPLRLPHDQEPLCFKFAGLSGSEESFLDFASGYGSLLLPSKAEAKIWLPQPETLSFWQIEHEKAKEAVLLWNTSSSQQLQALKSLAILINDQLHTYKVYPMLILDAKNRFKQSFVPSNVIAAIWMQFLQIFTGERKYKQCELCGLWADVTDSRANWRYHISCYNTHRTQEWRKKQKTKEANTNAQQD